MAETGPALLTYTPICYKPDMRKWMRDKLKRRKKTQEEATSQPAPLQPAYFEPEGEASQSEPPQEPAPAQASASVEPSPDPETIVTPDNAASEASPEPPSRAGATRPRRRRGRGGRGRKRSGQSASPATPASEGLSVPASAASTSAPHQSSKGVVVLAIGLPGSGKSSWFKRNNITPLSSDMIRALLFDNPDEQRFQDLVFSNLRSMLRARLVARRPTNYVDATNLTPHERDSWIKLAKDYGYEAQALYFDVPLEVCLERNQKRQRVVGEDIMRKMAAKLKAPTFEEGFSKITVVRVKQKE